MKRNTHTYTVQTKQIQEKSKYIRMTEQHIIQQHTNKANKTQKIIQQKNKPKNKQEHIHRTKLNIHKKNTIIIKPHTCCNRC